ncbi:hypothetical protein [Chishuiella sp.]|uniref:hypothetical protein n=1 Tax=Chishuiella sp. TaxID=1969467 RepID=UPI0028AE88F9|nr:hypothetical protein [Chishuiella sp.]
MNEFPKEEFLTDFLRKKIVQEEQFNQWLRILFYLNNELTKKWDFVYQDMFYIKFYEVMTEGFSYANKVFEDLKKGENQNKLEFYEELIKGLTIMKSELQEDEYNYIEYRRHNICHIFQNGYEYIQDNLKIKKEIKGKDLQKIKNEFEKIIDKYGSDKNFDIFLNKKLQPNLTQLYTKLIGIHNKQYNL